MKTLLFTCLVILFISCKKEDSQKQCPLQTFKIQCDTSTWDLEFGGYNTGTDNGTIQANCPKDAAKVAKDMSYDLGEVYKHCRIIP